MLHSENITADNQKERPSKKLANRYIGPYSVIEKIGSVAYRLQLPDSMKIHNVFHVSRLKPYKPSSEFHDEDTALSRPDPMIVQGEEEFEVESIVGKRIHRGRTQYLVHWLGYHDSERTWVNGEDLGNCRDLVEEFEENLTLEDQQTFLKRGRV